jgi:hypothetical protein
MKKYLLALLVLCLADWLAGRQNTAQTEMPQDRVTAVIELQTADGPAYLVCIETTNNMSPGRLRGLTIPGIRELQSSIAKFFPDSVTVMLLALSGYLLGGRRR